MTRLRSIGFYLLVSCIAACGGGGGSNGPISSSSSSSSSIDSTAKLNLSSDTIIATADASTNSNPNASVAITFNNVDPSTLTVSGKFSKKGILSASLNWGTNNQLTLLVFFRDPAVIGSGTYQDTVTLQMCSDAQCVNTIGLSKSIAVTYTVTGTAPPKPTLTLVSNTVIAQALPFNTGPVTAVAPFTVSNVPFGYRIDFSTSTYSKNGIESINFGTSNIGGSAVITFKSPVSLGVGTYDDVIILNACDLDTTSCQWNLDTPQTINVHYMVSNTITGNYGYTANAYPVSANELAWDGTDQLLIASVPSTAPAHGNSVVTLSPTNGTIKTAYQVGGNPNVLAISDDDHYLYVGKDSAASVDRLVLPSLTPDISIPLQSSTTTNPLVASDIEVAPHTPHTAGIAVSTPPYITPSCVALQIFDDTTLTSYVNAGGINPCISHFQWSDSSATVYATEGESYPSQLFTLAYDGSSLQLTNTFSGTGLDFVGYNHYVNGYIYTRFGSVFDIKNQTMAGSFAFADSTIWSSLPDVAHGKLFELAVNTNTGWTINSYDITSHVLLATIFISDNNAFSSTRQHKLIRWGTDGIAFATEDNRVIVINGAFVTQP